MRINRVYHPEPLTVGQTYQLSDTTAHHLARVLRVQVGDNFVVFNGQGGEYPSEVIEANKKQLSFKVTAFDDVDRESNLNIHLAQAVSRGEKMDFVMQKAVELGVSHITPIITERCGVKLSVDRWQKKLDHWQAVIISACEQSGRTVVPLLSPAINFSDFLAQVQGTRYILHPEGGMSINKLSNLENKLTLLIGSEGGFTQQEVQSAKDSDFQCLSLGPRILRTETAALAAVTALQTVFGDF